MTAAEKREKWLGALSSAVLLGSDMSSGGTQARRSYLREVADLLTFTDDAPATPAQEPDWRDGVVSWGTGWEKAEDGPQHLVRRDIWEVYGTGETYADDLFVYGPGDPLSRCRAIDRFLSELAGEGV